MSLTPYFDDGTVSLYLGDCRTVLAEMPDASVDAVVTDPPAGVSFMGRDWDSDRGGRDRWIEWLTVRMEQALRVLKPGGHALVWALPRTSHWTAMALEDAGFDIRDCVLHLFGSGFPKSLAVSRAINKAANAERPVLGSAADFARDGAARRTDGSHAEPHSRQGGHGYGDRWSVPVTGAATPEAAEWDGWGTALKPGQEIWWLARKPLQGTVVANVLAHGTGALNIDGCRTNPGTTVPGGGGFKGGHASRHEGWIRPSHADGYATETHSAGRWPTNLIFTHSAACVEDGPCAEDCPVAELDRQSGVLTSGANPTRRGSDKFRDTYGEFSGQRECTPARGADSGGASRYFPVFRYEAKAPTFERPKLADGTAWPTVKPLDLMRWLVRLVTPPGGLVLDLFAGTGTTGEACVVEGFRSLLIESDPAAAELIKARLTKPIQPTLGEVS